ncbi:FAD-dependent oxidoreductase [Pseudomarimonas salicorniae]|uniref:FAD-dependent oxidoreductase n=1 Tax=Pseudomarimonas salicorniae TaxID=2933270 RepID=A0ABT0GEN5_9GAMM|nr:FAD-dependent oxidoreductase [Lysobacter sp. CAU 1642]MCK7593014.1 FAD-dependent oxidoreductase [Lysobacter sp. CAU 1642]
MTRSIAVIGSGIAGLAAAHGCRAAGFQVTLFEAQPDIGMAAHTLKVDGGIVDVPLRVMNPKVWRSTLALARRVKVETFPVEVNSSCTDARGHTWFRSARMPLTGWPITGSWRHLGPKAARLGLGMLWLARLTRRLHDSRSDLTLGEVLDQETVDPLFWRGLILPILLTICTCDEEHLLAWPAGELLDVLHQILHEGQSLRLRGGTHALASALADGVSRHVGSKVAEVRQRPSGIEVHNQRGDGGRYDAAIVATQANQLDFLDAKQFSAERDLLKGIRYAHGELVVHRDERFMPRHRRDWSELNFQVDPDTQRPMFTVWVNAVEPTLAHQPPVFQTWNPNFEPDPKYILARQPLQRAVVTADTRDILKALNSWHRQPGRKLFYSGSWAHKGVPLLESAVRSANGVVKLLKG